MRFVIKLLRRLPGAPAPSAYAAVRSALLDEGARIRREHPPYWIVAVHGGGWAIPEWHRPAKKRLEFFIVPDDDGPFVFVHAIGPLLSTRALRAHESEARQRWGGLLDDLWRSTELQLAGKISEYDEDPPLRFALREARNFTKFGALVLVLASVFTACRLGDLSGASVKEALGIIAQAGVGATFAAGGLAAMAAGLVKWIRADAVQAEHRRLSRLASRMRV